MNKMWIMWNGYITKLQVDILARELYLEFSHMILGPWCEIWTLRPGFYSEFRYKSREHRGLAWVAILRKVLVLTLLPKLPCSFFQEHFPQMDSFANVPRQQGAFKYFQVPRSLKWLVFQYFQASRHWKWLVFQYFQVLGSSTWLVSFLSSVFPGSQVIKTIRFPVCPGSQVIKILRFPICPGLPPEICIAARNI